MVGVFGCEDGKTYTESAYQSVSLVGLDDVNLIETYRSVDYEYTWIIFPEGQSPDGYNIEKRLYSQDGHFEVSFDVYTKEEYDCNSEFIKSITINSIDYEYGEAIDILNIDSLEQ